MEKDKRLMDASWWERWGKRSCSGGAGRASKHLNQFSVEWQGCAPFPVIWPEAKLWRRWWRQWWPPWKGAKQAMLYSVPPTPEQGTAKPRLFWRLLDAHGQVWARLFWGPCFFLWVLRSRGSVSLRSLFRSPLYVLEALWWVKGDLLREGFCHAQLHCTQTPCPCGRPLLTRTSPEDTQTHKMDYYSVLKWRNF